MASISFLFLASLLTVSAAMVLRFRQRLQEEYPEFAEVLKNSEAERFLPAKYFQERGIDSESRLQSFSWKNCGDASKELLDLTALSITPDPIILPGSFNLGFNAVFRQIVTSPLKAEVQIKKKFAGVWVTIPCVDNFGSCSYDDFCDVLLFASDCPAPFQTNDVPCECPFPKGNYTLPPSSFFVDASFLPSGDYFGQIDLSMNGQAVGCYQLDLTLQ